MSLRRYLQIVICGSVIASCGLLACRKPPAEQSDVIPPSGEPDEYSATVVRTVDEGSNHSVTVTTEFKSGELRRVEWTEGGRNRALIWKPDSREGFLLDLDGQTYVEATAAGQAATAAPGNNTGSGTDPGSSEIGLATVQAIDRAFDEAPSPDRVEIRSLPAEMIDNRKCSVFEKRAVYPDGHTEITISCHAIELRGLSIRVETRTEPATTRIVTERRDVRVALPAGIFDIPEGFKKRPQ